MKAKQRNQRKEQPMNPLTQFKRILILPLLLALALDRARAHGRTRGCGDRLEPDRVKRDRCNRRATAVGVGAALRHGAWGGVRRGQRDRPRPPAVPRAASIKSNGLEGSGRGDSGVPRARGYLPRAAGNTAAALRRVHSGPPRQSPGIEGCGDRYR